MLAEVRDEGEFWERRDVAVLAETVGQWNQQMAAIVGRFKDCCGNDLIAPITEYPDFEHLEARGEAIPRLGDRIRLLAMRDDPDPIQPGQVGTVMRVSRHGSGEGAWRQIEVAWDDGRTLMLACPPDRYEIVRRAEEPKKDAE